MCVEKLLKNIDLFSSLNKNDLDDIIAITTVKKLQSDNVLFYEGSQADYFYFLLEGQLKLYKTGIKSQEIILHHFIEPGMVAEMATLEDMKFPATAVSIKDDTLVAMIEKEEFIDILSKNQQLPFHIIKSLTKKIKNLELSIRRNLVFDATMKVCSLLKENSNILVTHKNVEIARILNIAPETLSRTFAKLKKLEILDKNNNILDIQKLDAFLEL